MIYLFKFTRFRHSSIFTHTHTCLSFQFVSVGERREDFKFSQLNSRYLFFCLKEGTFK